jgi:hypothetical protein
LAAYADLAKRIDSLISAGVNKRTAIKTREK